MSRAILLDAGPLGMITHPRRNPQIQFWLRRLAHSGVQVIVPEIADYEVRRELIRAEKTKGLERLDAIKSTLRYAPLTTEIMLEAARFWARARQQGRPTASDKALDGDVILAAQAAFVAREGFDCVIATDNVGHLGLFVAAKPWNEIE